MSDGYDPGAVALALWDGPQTSFDDYLAEVTEALRAAHIIGAAEMREQVRAILRDAGEGVVALHELRAYIDEAMEAAKEPSDGE